METVYTNLYNITELQQKIMRFVDYWVHVEKTPIPRQQIILQMNERSEKDSTIINAINGLLKLGYLRRAVMTYADEKKPRSQNNETFYVQLRRI